MAGFIHGEPDGMATVAKNLTTPQQLEPALAKAATAKNMPECASAGESTCGDFTTKCREAAGHAEKFLKDVQAGFQAYREGLEFSATDYRQSDQLSAEAIDGAMARTAPPPGATDAINDEIADMRDTAGKGGS